MERVVSISFPTLRPQVNILRYRWNRGMGMPQRQSGPFRNKIKKAPKFIFMNIRKIMFKSFRVVYLTSFNIHLPLFLFFHTTVPSSGAHRAVSYLSVGERNNIFFMQVWTSAHFAITLAKWKISLEMAWSTKSNCIASKKPWKQRAISTCAMGKQVG